MVLRNNIHNRKSRSRDLDLPKMRSWYTHLCLVKRSWALRGRNPTRDSQTEGASMTHGCPDGIHRRGSPFQTPSNARVMPRKIQPSNHYSVLDLPTDSGEEPHLRTSIFIVVFKCPKLVSISHRWRNWSAKSANG